MAEREFKSRFGHNEEKYRSTIIHRPPVFYGQNRGGALEIAVALSPANTVLWREAEELLGNELALAERLAAGNGLQFSAQMRESGKYPEFVVTLKPLSDSLGFKLGPRRESMCIENAGHLGLIQFPVLAGLGDRAGKLAVATPVCAFESAAAAWALYGAVDGVTELNTRLGDRWMNVLQCGLVPSGAISVRLFEEGYFEVELQGNRAWEGLGNGILKGGGFPPDERAPRSPLERHLENMRGSFPSCDYVCVLANVVRDTEFQGHIAKLFTQFERVRVDIQPYRPLWQLYNPEQALAVTNIALAKIVRHFDDNSAAPGDVVCIKGAKNTLYPGSGAPLFAIEVFNQAGQLVQVGAFNGTEFILKVRQHNSEDEMVVLELVSRAEQSDPLRVPCHEVGLQLLSEHQRVLEREAQRRHAETIERMQEIVRDPWMRMVRQDGNMSLEAVEGRPRELELDVSHTWGTFGDTDITSWRRAVRLYELSEMRKQCSAEESDGDESFYPPKFIPNSAFMKRYEERNPNAPDNLKLS
jgi:hypothetical protein